MLAFLWAIAGVLECSGFITMSIFLAGDSFYWLGFIGAAVGMILHMILWGKKLTSSWARASRIVVGMLVGIVGVAIASPFINHLHDGQWTTYLVLGVPLFLFGLGTLLFTSRYVPNNIPQQQIE